MDLENYNMKEIMEMVRLKKCQAWSHTSALLAMILNVNKDCKKHGVTPFDEYNVFASLDKSIKVKRVISDAESKRGFAMMKKVFVDNAPERRELARLQGLTRLVSKKRVPNKPVYTKKEGNYKK